jgi:hypothetical protein
VASKNYYFAGATSTGVGTATKPGALLGSASPPFVTIGVTGATFVQIDLSSAPINFPAGWSYFSLGCTGSFSAYGQASNGYRIPPGFNATTDACSGTNYQTWFSSSANYYYDPAMTFTAQGTNNTQGITFWWRYA